MFLAAAIVSCLTIYCLAGAWTFGYVAALDGDDHERDLDYYWDEPYAWFSAIFWPVTWLLRSMMGIVRRGHQVGEKKIETAKQRIEVEKRIRIQMEQEQREADEAVEEALKEPTHSRARAA